MVAWTADVSPPRCAMHSPVNLRVDITITADAGVPPGMTGEAVVSLARYVLAEEGMNGEWQFGIRFVDDPTMQQAHADFMGIDTPTDIMTFPYEDDGFGLLSEDAEDVLAGQGGDLLISAERAAANARDAGWETERELQFLVCHGILHILGWDDASDEERSRMLDRQQNLVTGWLEQ